MMPRTLTLTFSLALSICILMGCNPEGSGVRNTADASNDTSPNPTTSDTPSDPTDTSLTNDATSVTDTSLTEDTSDPADTSPTPDTSPTSDTLDPPDTSIDECALNLANCHIDASCINTPDGFSCTCNSGFSGDGITCTPACPTGYTGTIGNCTDINECLENTHNCSPNALCDNSPGGFSCTCDDGFSGDGFICNDIDACTQPCDANATCLNTSNGPACVCNSGFSGDGTTCTQNTAGLCQNTPDLTFLSSTVSSGQYAGQIGSDAAYTAAGSCGLENFSDPDPSAAVAACMQSAPHNIALSDGCTSCYGDIVLCTIEMCLASCLGGPSSPACTDCQAQQGCTAAFATCTGF